MKIVCDNCATKYSIADEKVRGKVFKIRCKKCSHIIVVKGVEGEAAVDSAAPADEAAPPEDAAPAGDGWHVVINGEQVGPLSPAEVRAKFSGGEIDAETFAWKEGFGDWQRLASIDEFSDLASAPPTNDMTRRTGSDDLFGGGNEATSASNDLFGGPGGDLFAGSAPAAAAPSAGLFAQPTAPEPARRPAPTPGFGNRAIEEAPAPIAAAPAEGGGKAMTGQRNENSVLFSLNNLQALASGGPSGPKAQAPSPNAAGIDNRPGFANSQTEGSGLIDIRAMAAATLSTSPSSSSSRNNDLPAFSSAPVFSPIAAPILM
ncbi:MAG: GYF domain-containing protein, partial [Polyangia bacterium]